MNQLTADWLTQADDFINYVSGNTEPITFFLGAGASISSGAPTTSAVERALLEATAGRFSDGVELRASIHRITPDEKRVAIEPLFSDLRPYIGYRCLSAIAQKRLVPGRPKFAALMRKVQAGQLTGILCWKLEKSPDAPNLFEPARGVILLLNQAKTRFLSGGVHEKRAIVAAISSNQTLLDGKVLIRAKKPFRFLTEGGGCPGRCVCLTKSEPFLNGTDGALRAPN